MAEYDTETAHQIVAQKCAETKQNRNRTRKEWRGGFDANAREEMFVLLAGMFCVCLAENIYNLEGYQQAAQIWHEAGRDLLEANSTETERLALIFAAAEQKISQDREIGWALPADFADRDKMLPADKDEARTVAAASAAICILLEQENTADVSALSESVAEYAEMAAELDWLGIHQKTEQQAQTSNISLTL